MHKLLHDNCLGNVSKIKVINQTTKHIELCREINIIGNISTFNRSPLPGFNKKF
jgi:hypothetical protein